jgi:hypothetical protein
MKIITDLNYIEQMGRKKDDENWDFRTYLKQLDIASEELDAIVHQITAEVSLQIDCTECGNCCKQVRPVLDEDDVSEFARGLKISGAELKGQSLRLHDNTPSQYQFNALPCPYLEDSRCSNYECRPKGCRSYPHLHKDRFISRLWGVVANYSVCPIVFNVYERLKTELWH